LPFYRSRREIEAEGPSRHEDSTREQGAEDTAPPLDPDRLDTYILRFFCKFDLRRAAMYVRTFVLALRLAVACRLEGLRVLILNASGSAVLGWV
jgi:hypothetical protein